MYCKISSIKAWNNTPTNYGANEVIKFDKSKTNGKIIELKNNSFYLKCFGTYLITLDISAKPTNDNNPVILTINKDEVALPGGSLTINQANNNQDPENASLTTVVDIKPYDIKCLEESPIISITNTGTASTVAFANITIVRL